MCTTSNLFATRIQSHKPNFHRTLQTSIKSYTILHTFTYYNSFLQNENYSNKLQQPYIDSSTFPLSSTNTSTGNHRLPQTTSSYHRVLIHSPNRLPYTPKKKKNTHAHTPCSPGFQYLQQPAILFTLHTATGSALSFSPRFNPLLHLSPSNPIRGSQSTFYPTSPELHSPSCLLTPLLMFLPQLPFQYLSLTSLPDNLSKTPPIRPLRQCVFKAVDRVASTPAKLPLFTFVQC